ncbi:hypothetical protein [Anaerotruncus rubiinfantis]|jgi:metal-responsive CopG/Arc/MetJ family transcriptional regulator|uniref:hypothetical protein n=1 Tax=Anaerotruncus rubiinfantis TaxID=1720200 RepID=UPI0011CC4091|nr:hypothetical protein [Anaerotruncus rubiinfantis]
MKKKMGRPTDKPKITQIAVRFDSETLQILDAYCEQERIGRSEGVRRAVQKYSGTPHLPNKRTQEEAL